MEDGQLIQGAEQALRQGTLAFLALPGARGINFAMLGPTNLSKLGSEGVMKK
jgi:hypothetical protein